MNDEDMFLDLPLEDREWMCAVRAASKRRSDYLLVISDDKGDYVGAVSGGEQTP